MSNRPLTPALAAAINAPVIRPVLFYEGQFVDSMGSPTYVRLWTGLGTLNWNGVDWTGGGSLLKVSAIAETGDLQANGFVVSLSGLDVALVSVALSLVRQGKPGTLWLGALDDTRTLIADPYQLQRGKFDISKITDTGDTCTVAAQYESRLVDLEKPRAKYYTVKDQAISFPADRGFDFVPGLQNQNISWGAGTTPAPSGAGVQTSFDIGWQPDAG